MINEVVITKRCTKCGVTKSTKEFNKNAGTPDGLRLWCKACSGSALVKYRAHNRDKVKAARAALYVANRDRIKAKSVKWRSENPGKAKAGIAKWKKENLESLRANELNRRARKLSVGGKLSKNLVERLFKLQRGKCACGCEQPLGNNYHRDHIMPLALGGSNTDDNIQLLRQRCNNQKKAKHPADFMRERGFLI